MWEALVTVGVLATCVLGIEFHKNYRASNIVYKMNMYFDEECSAKFREEFKTKWLHVNKPVDIAVLTTYEEWQTNGKWEECMRRC